MKSAPSRIRVCTLPTTPITHLHLKRRSFWRPAPLLYPATRIRGCDGSVAGQTGAVSGCGG
jgi:hypothetical protein